MVSNDLRLLQPAWLVALIDVGSAQQTIESANPILSVATAFQHIAGFAGFVSSSVTLRAVIGGSTSSHKRRLGNEEPLTLGLGFEQ